MRHPGFLDKQSSSDVLTDFIDYMLALYAHRYTPTDARIGFLDTEINNNTNPFSGHRVHTLGENFTTDNNVSMAPRSSRYWEFNPASACDFISYTFDGNGDEFAFSVMTVDGGTLQGCLRSSGVGGTNRKRESCGGGSYENWRYQKRPD
ncbi:MAG: hypothetical protein AAF639_03620 [Chloroflexota bacterium]